MGLIYDILMIRLLLIEIGRGGVGILYYGVMWKFFIDDWGIFLV